MTAGADVVIHSLHKTLPSLTQTALIHFNGNRIDRGAASVLSDSLPVQQSFLYSDEQYGPVHGLGAGTQTGI